MPRFWLMLCQHIAVCDVLLLHSNVTYYEDFHYVHLAHEVRVEETISTFMNIPNQP